MFHLQKIDREKLLGRFIYLFYFGLIKIVPEEGFMLVVQLRGRLLSGGDRFSSAKDVEQEIRKIDS